jgi:hypothetical protein
MVQRIEELLPPGRISEIEHFILTHSLLQYTYHDMASISNYTSAYIDQVQRILRAAIAFETQLKSANLLSKFRCNDLLCRRDRHYRFTTLNVQEEVETSIL